MGPRWHPTPVLLIPLLGALPTGLGEARAAELGVRVEARREAQLVYQAAPLRLVVTNEGVDPVRMPADAFASDHLVGSDGQGDVPQGWAYPQLEILRPDGTTVITDVATLNLSNEESHPSPQITLAGGDSTSWSFLLSVPWDGVKREPIFSVPGDYSVSGLVYTSSAKIESTPITLNVRVPTDAASRRALETIGAMPEKQLWGYYAPQYAELWGEDLNKEVPSPIRALATDRQPSPYRDYARLALASAHLGAAEWALAGREQDPRRAAVIIREGEALLEGVGDVAEELRSSKRELSERLDRAKRRVRAMPPTEPE